MTPKFAERPEALGKPIGIYYEHPDWFRPLFQELDERGVKWEKIDARSHTYNPGTTDVKYSLVFNRMSPSAWQRGPCRQRFLHAELSGTPGSARSTGG